MTKNSYGFTDPLQDDCSNWTIQSRHIRQTHFSFSFKLTDASPLRVEGEFRKLESPEMISGTPISASNMYFQRIQGFKGFNNTDSRIQGLNRDLVQDSQDSRIQLRFSSGFTGFKDSIEIYFRIQRNCCVFERKKEL